MPSGTEAGESPGGLYRLPPGRHGLSREFVARNQRDRIVAGAIAAVSELGYAGATVADVCAAAGVSRRTFYVYFEDKRSCAIAAFDEIAEHLSAAAGEEAAGEGEWPRAVAARIRGALAVFAANPDLARFTLIAPPRAGGALAEHYREALDRALAGLTAGMPTPPAVQAPSEAVQQALLGGALSIVVERVEEGEGEGLGDLLPELTELFLAPFVGREAAALAGR